ncbi:MAG: SLC13 family permease [Rhodocyclaceae bacterium]|jgi:sodium-dependent dicarboxylate transporter 2/3/5|nr:SLC13 family permease [Rhodocyclaceae bacterium]
MSQESTELRAVSVTGLAPPLSDELASKFKSVEGNGEEAKARNHAIKWLLIAAFVGLVIYLLPTPDGLSDRGHKFLALLAFIMIMWTSEAVPIGVTALGVGAGLALLGIQSPAKAWQPYAHQTVVFVFTIIMMGVIIAQTSLPNRILNWVMRLAGRNVKTLSFTLCMSACFLAAWTHDAAITIILLFSILPIFAKLGITPAHNNSFAKHFMLVIPLGASSGGGGTFVGSGRSPVSAEMFMEITGYNVGFMEYMSYQLVPTLVYGLGTWLAVMLVFPPKMKELPAEIQIEKLSPMRRSEKSLAVVLLVTLLLWMLSDVTKVHVSVIGAAFVMVCMFFGLANWKKSIEEFPWNPMMVFGAGFALGIAMLDTGAGKWIAEQLVPLLQGLAWPVVSWGIGWISAIITSFMANAAATALLVPIVVPMADLSGTPTLPMAMTVPLATTFVLLVIGCPPTLIAYGLGYFTQWEAFKVFFVRALICLTLAGGVQALWWPFVGMPGNLDMMQTPAKLGVWGVEVSVPKQP